MNALSIRNLWKPLAVTAALAFVYATTLRKLGFDWWTDENYSHGLLIPLVIGCILWTKREQLRRVAQNPSPVWGGSAVLLALFALWAGTAGAELYLQRLSLLLMLAGVVIYFRGFQTLRIVLVPLFLLWLAMPVPVIIFNKIAFPLQLFASRCAVWAMRLFDIPVLRQGNIIELMPKGAAETKKLEVVQACSGIRSLMTLVTLAVVFAYFTYKQNDGSDGSSGTGGTLSALKTFSFWRAAIIILSAVPIAILTNAARVSGTGILAHHYGTEVADSFFHSFSGWVIYLVALLLLFAVGWLIDVIGNLTNRGGDDSGGTAAATAQESKSLKAEAGKASAAPIAVNAVSAKGVGD